MQKALFVVENQSKALSVLASSPSQSLGADVIANSHCVFRNEMPVSSLSFSFSISFDQFRFAFYWILVRLQSRQNASYHFL